VVFQCFSSKHNSFEDNLGNECSFLFRTTLARRRGDRFWTATSGWAGLEPLTRSLTAPPKHDEYEYQPPRRDPSKVSMILGWESGQWFKNAIKATFFSFQVWLNHDTIWQANITMGAPDYLSY
jgi:hypothetical protein